MKNYIKPLEAYLSTDYLPNSPSHFMCPICGKIGFQSIYGNKAQCTECSNAERREAGEFEKLQYPNANAPLVSLKHRAISAAAIWAICFIIAAIVVFLLS